MELTGTMHLRDININDLKDEPIFRLSSAHIDLGSLRPLSNDFHITKITIYSPELLLQRDKNGAINLQSLVEQQAKISTPEKKITYPSPSKKAEFPYVMLDQFQIQGGKLFFLDEMPVEAVHLTMDNLNLQADSLSTVKESKGNIDFSLELDKQGKISVKGRISIDPLNATFAVDAKNIALAPFQPYFTDKIKINIRSGSFSTAGNIDWIDSGQMGMKIRYAGTASITNFVSVEKENGKDFLKWKSLFFDELEGGYNPLYLHIKDVSLTDFYSRLAIEPDGMFNVQKIMITGETSPESPASLPEEQKQASAAKGIGEPDISIGKVTLQGGRIDFSDYTIKPYYSTQLKRIGGRISGLFFTKNEPADVELRGKIGSDVPLEIVGKINPVSDNLFVDLTAKFRGLDLSPFTPYSRKYLGYTIEKGKLSLDVKYLIVKKKLDSQNRIFFDQFTLGDKVESKDAVKLPVKLAISLLKDRNGRIDLDIPVSGHLDDPEFNVWKIVVKILKNLIAKAATSPFALLGRMFGGGEELSYIEFDYGSARVNDENLKKIEHLVKAISDRPEIKLEITGYCDKEKDYEGLKNYLFSQKIKAQKLQKSGEISSGVSVDDITIEPEEYEKYLTLAYKETKFPKPRTALGLLKKLPVSEMEKLMLTNIKITDDDLRALAHQRASTVQELILKSGQINPERIFIIEPKNLTPEKKENLKNSRVEFSLERFAVKGNASN